MSYISDWASITCNDVIWRTREEEKELRDSYAVKESVKHAENKDKKKKNYYRLVNGKPANGVKTGWRKNEWLVESGYFLLDCDDHTVGAWRKVWDVMKTHTKEWGIVHVERSARGGMHITCIRTEGLTIQENIRLMELKTGFVFDDVHDLARACFLVPNDHVLYQDKRYEEDETPEPLPLSEEDREMLEKDRKEQEEEHLRQVEERRKTAPRFDGHGLSDEKEKLVELVNLICQSGVDITYDYSNWILIGFCITNIMGCAGENLFHQISSLYHNYDQGETSRVYQQLTRTTRREITLGTLIHLAREEGVVL